MRGIWRVALVVGALGALAYSQGLIPSGIVETVTGAANAVSTAVATPAAPQSATNAAQPSEYVVTARGQDGKVGGWSTCRPVNIVVNLDGAPRHALDDLRVAVKKLRAATGLDINLAVDTSGLKPTKDWGQRKEAGFDGWAPVLLAWAPQSSGLLTVDGSSAIATPVWVTTADGHAQFVSGQIVFNSDHNQRYASGFEAGQLSLGALFEHELGHIVGLDHVDSVDELMYPEMGHAGQYAAGDLAGLKQVASGTGCRPEPATSW